MVKIVNNFSKFFRSKLGIALASLIVFCFLDRALFAVPEFFGDLDEDGQATVSDIAILVNHIGGNTVLDPSLQFFADLNQDGSIDQKDVEVIAEAAVGRSTLPPFSGVPIINDPGNSTNQGSLNITGKTEPNFSIRVDGGESLVTGSADEAGNFQVNVALNPNRLNRLFVRSEDDQGRVSPPRSFEIIQDNEPPKLFIDFPEDGAELTNDSIVVAGRVSDRLSGFMGLDVKVVNTTVEDIIPGYEPDNPQLANVIVGIGTNGTYERGQVPLDFGENVLLVEAKDIHGTTITEEIAVTRVELSGRQMTVVSGDLQKAQVNTQLPDPIVLRVTDSDGNPIFGKVVNFEVTRSNGRLTTDPNSTEPGKVQLQVRTDNNGEARAWWTMGSDAGCGNNRVAVTSRNIAGTVFFCASADPAPARQINVGSGNNQRGEINAPAPERLRAWVNDTCNGVPGTPVTFTVIEGDGKIQGLPSATVESSITGHAEVEFILGPEAGKHVVEATFPGNPGFPVTFTLVGVERQGDIPTSFRGLVHDNAMQPIGGAVCTLTFPEGEPLTTTSGADGQFIFTNIGAGPAHLHVNGQEADMLNGNTIPKGSFPALSYDVLLVPNVENTLPTPVLLPELDPENAVLDYDGEDDLELTIKGIDDLKMIIRAGSMKLVDGNKPSPSNKVTVSLNQVHFDEVPMPMPDGAAPPFAWTLQPAGATFDPPVEVIYPNMTGLPEGAITYFLSFDHDTNKFEIVATGHVIEGGFCSVTDPGSGISKAGWGCQCPPYPPVGNQSNNNEQPKATCDPPPNQCSPYCKGGKGDPVDIAIGEFYEKFEDLQVKGRGFDFIWTRTYRSKIGANTVQGNGWDFNYNINLEPLQDDLILCDGGGRRDRYQPQTDTTWTRNEQFRELRKNLDNSFTYEFEDTSRWIFYAFDGLPQQGKIFQKIDRNGNTMTFNYDNQGRLSKITDTLDRDILIAHNEDGFIESVTDFKGRVVRYEYYQDGDSGGSFGDLKSCTTPAVVNTPNGNDFPEGKTTSFTYTTGFDDDQLNHNLLTITDGRRNDPNDDTFGQGPYVVNVYSSSTNANDFNQYDRIIRQEWGGDILDFAYSSVTPTAANGFAVTKVIVNDRNGNVEEYFFDVRNRAVVEREFTGVADPRLPTTDAENRPTNKFRSEDPDFFETRYEWNPQALQSRIIHPNGNITEFVYDLDTDPTTDVRSRGNLRTKRYLPGTHIPIGDQTVIEEHFEYDVDDFNACCGFNFITKHTDGRDNETIHEYDERGNRIRTRHRIESIVEEWEYNQWGQITKHTLPDNGSNHRRVDVYTYYTKEEDDDQEGYLKEEIIDAENFALTTKYEYDLVGNVIKKTDPRGHDTQYVINELDQVVREISREVTEGSDTRYERDTHYDANNNVIRLDIENINDQNELETNTHFTTTYEYEILNYLIRRTEEVDEENTIVTEYEYDNNRNLEITRFGEATNGNQPTNTLTQIYDERDLLFQEIRAEGDAAQSTMQYDYDPNQNRIRMQHGLEDTPRITDYVYDGYNRLVETIDPMGNVMTYHYDENHNRVSERTDGELNDEEGDAENIRLSEVFYTYDEMDRLTRQEVEFFETDTGNLIPGGQTEGKAITVSEYSDNSQVIRTINDNNHQQTIAYDTANRQRVVTDHKGNSTTFEYDENNNAITINELEKSDLGNPDETYTTTNAYDGLDRLIETIDNIGNTHDYAYDSRTNQTVTVDALGNMIRHTYDGLNRLTQTTRFLTDTGKGEYESNDTNDDEISVGGASRRRLLFNQPSNTTSQITTQQTWDDTSRLTAQIDDNGNATTYAYDSLNRKIKDIYADSTEYTYIYDVHDNKIRTIDANGSETNCQFDLLDRQARKDIDVAETVSDATTFEIYQYDGLSRLVHAEDDDSLVHRFYDSMNNVIREELWIGDTSTLSPSGVVISVYDGVGNEVSCTYPSGRMVTCTFDDLERKKTISDQSGQIAEFFYIGPQRVERRDYGNGTRLDIDYDGIDNADDDFGVRQMVRTTHTKIDDDTILDDRTYRWDPLYNKTQRADVRQSGPQLTHDYNYDSIYRLRQTQVTDASSTDVRNTQYDLDGVGNRTTVTENQSPGTYTQSNVTPNPADFQLNQYTTTPFDTREYDLNGNLTAINRQLSTDNRQLTYDYRNQMVEHTDTEAEIVSSYAYDTLGRRIQKTIDGESQTTVNFHYCNLQVVEEQNEAGENQATYVYGIYIDEPLNMLRSTIGYYFHTDQLYNVVVLSDASGAVVERYGYEDYGEPIYLEGNSSSSPYLFTGRRYDRETGFYYFRARYLQPKSGRFTTRDPMGYIDGMNLFQYASDNPQTFMDPKGLAYCRCIQRTTRCESWKNIWRGLTLIRVCVRKKCKWRCYCPERDNCPDIPCKNLDCKLDHGIEVLKYYGPDITKPMGAAPRCADKVEDVKASGVCL